MTINAAAIQGFINFGDTKTAGFLGINATVYRPTGPANPVDPVNMIAQTPAWITTDANLGASKPNLYAKPIWYGAYDRTIVQVGDYLVTDTDTFFVTTQQSLLPSSLVQCNATMSIYRPEETSDDSGAQDEPVDQIIAQSWPVSALNGTKGELPNSHLPGETRAGWLLILIPTIPGVDLIRKGDKIIDDDDPSEAYEVSSNEYTDLGWRITAGFAGV